MRTEALHNRHVPDGTYSMRRIGGRLVVDASKMDYSAVAELLNADSILARRARVGDTAQG